MATLARKDPAEVKFYTFDFTPWLDDMGTTISSVTSVVAEAGLTVDSSTNTTKTVTARLSGGTAGTEYLVTCTFVTADGQTLIGTMRVPVLAK